MIQLGHIVLHVKLLVILVIVAAVALLGLQLALPLPAHQLSLVPLVGFFEFLNLRIQYLLINLLNLLFAHVHFLGGEGVVDAANAKIALRK